MEVEKMIDTPEMAEAATLMAQNIGFVWAKREAIFWKKLIEDMEKILDIKWGEIILEEKYYNLFYKEKEEFLDIDTIAKNIDEYRRKADYDIKIQLNRLWNDQEICLRVYEYNSQEEIYLQLDKEKGINYSDLALRLGLTKRVKETKYGLLGVKVNFYGRDVSEPTYELFDDEKLEEFVENTKTAILEKLEIIDKYLDA